MKDITRNIIRYIIETLLVVILLVFLARTGNMPVVVPERITDFIVDTTSQLFSGRAFSSFSGFLDDVGDFFLTGGTDRANKKQFHSCKRVVERYFERLTVNLNQITVNPKVRTALPDFGGRLSGFYATDYLKKIVDTYYDVEQLLLYTSTGKKIVEATAEKVNPIDVSAVNLKLLKLSVGKRTPIIRILKNGRFILISSFRSKGREKHGYVLMVVNDKELRRILRREIDDKEKYLYMVAEDKSLFISSYKGAHPYQEVKERITKGKISLVILQEEKYLSLKMGTRRNYLTTIEGFGQKLYIGFLGPEGSVLIFVLLLARFVLLVFAIWLIIYLSKKIYHKLIQLVRERRLEGQLLSLSLEKSLEAGQRTKNAALSALDVAKKATNLMEQGIEAAVTRSKVVVSKGQTSLLDKLPPVQLPAKQGDIDRPVKAISKETAAKRSQPTPFIEAKDGLDMEFDLLDE